jgi:excisionase family DNA binding protein
MESSSLSVRQAAELLGVSPMAVRNKIAAGRLPARKDGRDWRVDEREVRRLVRQPASSGRPLAPVMAWAVLLALSGERDGVDRMIGSQIRYRHRVGRWLAEHSLPDDLPSLRGRAESERFAAHPSELPRLLNLEVKVSGLASGDGLGFVGGHDEIDLYAPRSARDEIAAEHGLLPGDGPVLIRWVPDLVWERLPEAHSAPRAAVLADLMENEDPRVRREAGIQLAAVNR